MTFKYSNFHFNNHLLSKIMGVLKHYLYIKVTLSKQTETITNLIFNLSIS